MALILWLHAAPGFAQTTPVRAQQLGIPLEGTPGPLDAITDVPGVAIGHTTLIRGSGRLRVGVGPVRTGITAEEAIINALLAARTMVGADFLKVPALPPERLRAVLQKYNRLRK